MMNIIGGVTDFVVALFAAAKPKWSNGMVRALATAILLVLGAVDAKAASFLIDHTDTTLDTQTHLEWLDLTKTSSFTYNQVLNSTGVHYVDSGWSFASAADVTQLWIDAGGPPIVGGIGTSSTPAVNNYYTTAQYLSSLIGLTHPIANGGWSIGFVSGSVSGNPQFQPQVYFDFFHDAAYTGDYASAGFFADKNTVWAYSGGSYLVRAEVVATTPVPAALPLFVAALGALGLVGWRRKKAAIA